MKKHHVLTLILLILFSQTSYALFTEVGLQYSYNKKNYDESNLIESQSTTTSISFYIWDRVALETSYTSGLAVRKEVYSNYNRTITQTFDVYGADLILGFADRRASFQPYIKGGSSYSKKKQEINDGSAIYQIEGTPGWGPSYGAGVKMQLTEAFSVKASYDVWRTPNGDGTSSDDTATRAGLSMIF